jgi:hypothetical protein
LFYQELKDEYNAQFGLSDALETKSGQIITVCGIFIPLLFGFSAIKIDSAADPWGTIFTILLIISISLAGGSIFFCTWALRVRSYTHAFLPESFYNGGAIDQTEVSNFGNQTEDAFYDEMILEYLASNTDNIKANASKSTRVKVGLYLFVAALAIVPVLVGISFAFPASP